MPKPIQLPIFDSSNGRTIIGYASSVRGAEIALRRLLTIHPLFKLQVWARSFEMQEVLELPAGYCYSLGY